MGFGDAGAAGNELVFEVVAHERRTAAIVELRLRPVERPLAFLPGQYVLVEDADGLRPPRSYSIANAPRPDGVISLLFTRVAGGAVSPWLHDGLAVGDEVVLSGPYGTFVADPAAGAPSLYLAAGSGLAPIRALIEAAVARPLAVTHTLLCSAQTEGDVLDRDRFARLAAEQPRFSFLRTLTCAPGPAPVGRIPEVLADICGDLAGHHVFIAGSSPFVRDCEGAARRAGAPPEQVRTEGFSDQDLR